MRSMYLMRLAIAATLVVMAVLSTPLEAAVDLEWRPDTTTVAVDSTFTLSLYAVADSSAQETVSAMDVILVWEPSELALLGIAATQPGLWLSVAFPNDAGLDGLNNTFADGDALVTALAPLGTPVSVNTSGVLVATFEFEALAEAVGTTVEIPAATGVFSRTRVFDGTVPGLDILGLRGSAVVVVQGCGNTDYDDDEDGDVDLRDFAALQVCFSGEGVPADAPCLCPFDADSDGDVDLVDHAVFESSVTGPVAP